MTRDGLSLRMKDEDWDAVVAVNLTAGFLLARAALKGMTRRRHGRIVGITSVVGVTGNAGQSNYAASKAGMIGMSKSLAAEVATRDVTVNCVAPGFIASPMTDALNDKQRTAILSTIPAGRLGAGEDVAAAVVYLAITEAIRRVWNAIERRFSRHVPRPAADARPAGAGAPAFVPAAPLGDGLSAH